MLWLLTINLVGLVTSEVYQSGLYEKWTGSGNNLTTLRDISSIRTCTLKCLVEELWCHGFHYDEPTRICNLYGSCISGYGNDTIFARAAMNKDSFLLSQGKPANMSSQFTPETNASRGNDGIFNPAWWNPGYPTNGSVTEDSTLDSMFHTNQEANPWWRVDMEESHCVWAVYFMNRGLSDYWSRARNIMVTVSELESDIMDNGDNRCGYIDGAAEQFDNLVVCSVPMVGRYVQLQMMATDVFHLYEVMVGGR